MDEEEGGLGRLTVVERAAIDTRPPFKSVKEAVVLFREQVFVGEVVAPRLKQMREEKVRNESNGLAVSWKASLSDATELEETRGSLSKAREENNRLTNCMKHLEQELYRATREIKEFKVEIARRADPKIGAEDMKFMDNVTWPSGDEVEGGGVRFEVKQKSVKFSSPPLLTRVMVDKVETGEAAFTRPTSKNGMKKRSTKKVIVSVIARLCSKPKNGDCNDHADDNVQ